MECFGAPDQARRNGSQSAAGVAEGAAARRRGIRDAAAEIHGAAASGKHVFPLFADRETADAASCTRKISAISYFPGAVSGPAPGSAVTMHGLKVGEVADVRLAHDAAKDAVVAPVRFEVELECIVGVGHRVYKTDAEAVDALLRRVCRAQA